MFLNPEDTNSNSQAIQRQLHYFIEIFIIIIIIIITMTKVIIVTAAMNASINISTKFELVRYIMLLFGV